MTTVRLIAASPMSAVGGFLAITVSRCLSEALQHFQIGWFSLSVTSLESLKMLHARPAATFSLATSASFAGNFSSHRT